MTLVCPKCRHLMGENHTCPSPEYLEAHRRFVTEAAILNDLVTEDDEEYVWRARQGE